MSRKRLRVATVVGTRPELIRLSRVLSALDRYCDHVFIHTGQNYDYELNEIFFEDLDIRKPDFFLEAAGVNASETIGKTIIAVDQALSECKPEAVLVLGDTNSCLSVIPAKRKRIPVFHMEAGNRCFDMRVPEEINRRIVDHVSDINLPYSDIAREYLLAEGFPPDRIIKTGSPMYEVLSYYSNRIESSDVLSRLELTQNEYFVVSAHREENIDSEQNFAALRDVLNEVADVYGLPLIVSTHPRTRKRFESSGLDLNPLVRLHKPFKFTDYVKLQKNARASLSDSGTITEESSILNFRALNLREAHERPEGMEEGSVMMVGLSVERVMQGLEILKLQPVGEERLLVQVTDYNARRVSEKIVRIIHSYVDYVRDNVWKV